MVCVRSPVPEVVVRTLLSAVFLALAVEWIASGMCRGQEEPARVMSPYGEDDIPTVGPLFPPPVANELPAPPPTRPSRIGENTGGGFIGPGAGLPGYGVTWYPDQPVSGQNADLGLVRQSLNAGCPLCQTDWGMLMLNAGIFHSLFFTDAILPDTGRPFPRELWNVFLGLNYMHRFENGWSAGMTTSVGSASDKPFHGIEEMNVSVFGFLRMPARNERDAWMFSIFYSPAGNLNFPIPGVAYVWNPSEDLRVNIGLPFSVMWQPDDKWTVNMFYVPLTNINARVTYQLNETVRLSAGYEFLNESYFLADRIDSRDRFMAFEQRVIGVLAWDVARYAALEFNAGYAFDRFYGEGRNQGDDLTDRVDVAPGAFLGANLRMRF
jgi:hypothetical protein